MFEKDMRISYLLDFYGELLDEHILGAMRSYYNDDLSLAEVARTVGISRQGIRHLIKKGEEQLVLFEERLGLAERYAELSRAADELSEIAKRLSDKQDTITEAKQLTEIIDIIRKGN
jgi:predicted DNA-binding protein YlxM (UPF0122 family)